MHKIRRRLDLVLKTLRDGQSQGILQVDIPAISLGDVVEAKSFFPMPKFFIFGHARSGTTLLARLVRIHPDVHCNWQAHFFTQEPFLTSLVSNPDTAAWLARRNNRWNRGKDLSPVVMRAVSDFIMEREARREGKSVVGDKSPNSGFNGESVRKLHGIYPDSRLLFIVRDGRDTIVSHRFQNFIDSVDGLSTDDLKIREAYLHDPEPFLRKEQSLFSTSGLRRAANSWVENVEETDRAGRSLFGGSYLSLRYEDLLLNTVEVMNRIWEFLEVSGTDEELQKAVELELQDNPDADWQMEKEHEIAVTLRKGSSGSWKDFFTVEDTRLFKEVAGETLIAWDYEHNLSW